MLVTCVGGVRPNFVKLKPVVDALVAIGVEVDLVDTGQHYDDSMNAVFFRDLGLRTPDVRLDVGSGSFAEQVGRTMIAFEKHLATRPADVVVVVGDVNSTLAAALVGARSGALVAHVEAGLRSRVWSMPEEQNRAAVDRVADLLLAPSPDAVANLRAEGRHTDQIHLVGNVMVDSLLANVERARERPILDQLDLAPAAFGVVTLHRPSNVDDDATLGGLVSALNRIADAVRLVFPVHPRTKSHLGKFPLSSRITLLPPQGYLDFLALMTQARVILTDSGGVQEEATMLGVPCLTLRHETERPITVTEGTNRVVGTTPENIVDTARETLSNPPAPRRPALWDGRAGERVAAAIVDAVRSGVPRPTD